MADKFDFSKIERKARTALERSLILIGNTAKNHFIQSFRNQGFDDKSVQKWQPRKRNTYKTKGGRIVDDSTRAILVKSGDLRRSIKLDTVNKANLKIVISSDLPYAKIHNEGLQGKAWGKHSFKMPKRQFMGDSYNMNEKIKKVIINNLDKTFK